MQHAAWSDAAHTAHVIRNALNPLVADHRPLLDGHIRHHEALLARSLARTARGTPGTAALALTQSLSLAALNPDAALLAELQDAAAFARRLFIEDRTAQDPTVPPAPRPERRLPWDDAMLSSAPPQHDFVWHETTLHAPRGMAWRRYSDGLGLAGCAETADPPASLFDAAATAWFSLDGSRRKSSPTGLYRSAPWIDLRGVLSGYQGLFHPVLACAGRACTCALHLRQTIAEIDAAQGRATLLILGETAREMPLLDLRNRHGGAIAGVELPGALQLPAVMFRPSANRITYALLDIRLRFGLEGDAALQIGNDDQDRITLALFCWRPDPVF